MRRRASFLHFLEAVRLDDPKVVELSDEAEAIAADRAVKTAAEVSILEEGTAPER